MRGKKTEMYTLLNLTDVQLIMYHRAEFTDATQVLIVCVLDFHQDESWHMLYFAKWLVQKML